MYLGIGLMKTTNRLGKISPRRFKMYVKSCNVN